MAVARALLPGRRARISVKHGEVFTRRWVVEVMLDLIGYTVDRDLAALRLVEPACGSGAFVVPAVERLIASSASRRGALDGQALTALQAFDVQPQHVERCRQLVTKMLRSSGVPAAIATELAHQWIRQRDYLLSATAGANLIDQGCEPEADFVIGNPPYIRFDSIDDKVRAEYRARWPTMSGRADMYVGFYERALRSLKLGGRLAFICADRWMRNQYGSALRQLVARDHSVEAVWTMHDVDAFEAQVSSYPAITVMSRREQGEVVVAETSRSFDDGAARALAAWTLNSSDVAAEGVGYSAFRLPQWFSGEEMWPTGSPARIALIKRLNDNFESLHDPANGTRVGIGVTTGADKVYVLEHDDPRLDHIESDRLLKLAVASDTRSGGFNWGGRWLINPWKRSGELVDLADYPGLRAYLFEHRTRLAERHTAMANPRSWYRTIDKVSHELLSREKLLIQDMQTSLSPVFEDEGCYPHHNLYYVVSTNWDLHVLGGLLLSRVAQAFIEAYSVRMRGNTLRFQAQYLRRIRVPRYVDLGADTRQALRDAFIARDVRAATTAALNAYGLLAQDLD
ncbi:DNA methyltransferase [Nocardia sp. NRRL S-836]|nr:DNA methyltransferase [Nocardia sp. NRRL S-836]